MENTYVVLEPNAGSGNWVAIKADSPFAEGIQKDFPNAGNVCHVFQATSGEEALAKGRAQRTLLETWDPFSRNKTIPRQELQVLAWSARDIAA